MELLSERAREKLEVAGRAVAGMNHGARPGRAQGPPAQATLHQVGIGQGALYVAHRASEICQWPIRFQHLTGCEWRPVGGWHGPQLDGEGDG